MFVPARVETFTIILDSKGRTLSLPLTSLSKIIKKISDAYSMRLEKMMIVNCTYTVKIAFVAVRQFLAE